MILKKKIYHDDWNNEVQVNKMEWKPRNVIIKKDVIGYYVILPNGRYKMIMQRNRKKYKLIKKIPNMEAEQFIKFDICKIVNN